jgi:hypothetical protein
MAHPTADAHIDVRLARLLEIERDVEARVHQAEEAARIRVESARAEAAIVARGDDEEDHEAAREATEDEARHAEALAAIEAQSRAQLARLGGLGEAEIAALATWVIDALLVGPLVPREGAGCAGAVGEHEGERRSRPLVGRPTGGRFDRRSP